MITETSTSKEVQGTEKSEFKGTIKDGLVKIPVHLRPKSDEDLKKWKEKLAKGKEDGVYTYKFGGINNITDEKKKKQVATVILQNIKKENPQNPKLADGKVAFLDDIEKALEIRNYTGIDSVKFKVFKKERELLYLQVKAQGTKQHDEKFLNKEGAYFEVGKKCFCNRGITTAEFNEILKKLRDSEKVSNTTSLFYAKNCNLDDKSNESFVLKLNETFEKFGINTCIRKIHFLAQVYHETDKFQTTKEYGGKDSYKPYVGRGLMQLTWESNYKIYKSYSNVDVVTDYEKVAEELFLTVDSAGWYWKQGKVLSVGERWKASSDAPQYVKLI